MVQEKKYSAPALDKGLDILEFLSSSPRACSQAEIAQGLGRSPNEIYRLLVVLESRGYLIREEVSGKYKLSLRLYMLSHTHSPIEQLRSAAEIPMQELAATLGQACHLSVPYQDKLLVVSQVKGPNPVSLSISEGTLFPMVTTTSGRLLLAFFSAERREKMLASDEAFQAMGDKGRSALAEQLALLREKGHHFSPSEITMGVTDCAAFVGESASGIMATVAVSSLTSSLVQHHNRESVIAAVRKAADDIGARIGVVVPT